MDDSSAKRIMPHNDEAEKSVLGSMLIDGDAIMTASEILTPDDFYQKQYGIVFDAIVELANEGKNVDVVTLQNRLREKYGIVDEGDIVQLTDLEAREEVAGTAGSDKNP